MRFYIPELIFKRISVRFNDTAVNLLRFYKIILL